MMQKGLMSKFFDYDNIKKIAEPISHVINSHIDDMIKQEQLKDCDFKVIDFKDYTKPMFDDIVNLILFGFLENEKFPTVFGEKITVVQNKILELRIKLLIKPINILTSNKLRFLCKETKEIKRYSNEMIRVIWEEYQKRHDNFQTDNSRALNVLDLMVEHNINSEQSGRTDEVLDKSEIIGNMMAIQLAGSDTSQLSSTTGLSYISENEDLKKTLCEIVKDNNLDKILSDDVMQRTL